MRRWWLAVLTLTCLLVLMARSGLYALSINVWCVEIGRRLVQPSESMTRTRLYGWSAGCSREALWQGRLAMLMGDVKAAKAWFQRQSKVSPTDPLTAYWLGEAQLALGETDTGVAQLNRAGAFVRLRNVGWNALQAQRWDDAISALSAAHNLKPLDPLVISGLAYALQVAKHDYNSAVSLLGKSIDASLGDASLEASVVRWRLDLARVYEREDDWSGAVAVYKKILVDYPTNSRAHARLGWAMFNAKEISPVTSRELSFALALAPQDIESYMYLGRFHFSRQQYKGATEMFRLAAKVAPDVQEPLIALADTAVASGEIQLAIEVLDEAAAKWPDDAYIQYRIAGVYYWQTGDTRAAAIAIEKALAITRQDSRYWVLAGLIYEKAQQSSRATDCFQTALTLDPNSSVAKDGLARLQLEK